MLIKPGAPRASVILIPGGDGVINADDNGEIRALKFNQLVRTRHDYAARGLAVLVVDADTPLDGAIQYMAAIKRPVTVIATSRGTIRAAQWIARGGRPDALVLMSGLLSAEPAAHRVNSVSSFALQHVEYMAAVAPVIGEIAPALLDHRATRDRRISCAIGFTGNAGCVVAAT